MKEIIKLKHIGKLDENRIVTTVNGLMYKYDKYINKMKLLKFSKIPLSLYYGITSNIIGKFIDYDEDTDECMFELFDSSILKDNNEYVYGIIAITDTESYDVYSIDGFQLIKKWNVN